MKSYAEWCKHYNYDPQAEQSKEDYLQYKMEYKALTAYAECNRCAAIVPAPQTAGLRKCALVSLFEGRGAHLSGQWI